MELVSRNKIRKEKEPGEAYYLAGGSLCTYRRGWEVHEHARLGVHTVELKIVHVGRLLTGDLHEYHRVEDEDFNFTGVERGHVHEAVDPLHQVVLERDDLQLGLGGGRDHDAAAAVLQEEGASCTSLSLMLHLRC